jgi:hypothetical protein
MKLILNISEVQLMNELCYHLGSLVYNALKLYMAHNLFLSSMVDVGSQTMVFIHLLGSQIYIGLQSRKGSHSDIA